MLSCAGTQRYVHLKCLRRWQDVCALRKRVLTMDAKRDGVALITLVIVTSIPALYEPCLVT